MAPLVSKYFDKREKYLDVDIGVFDYALRCIEGPYIGKVFNVNTSPNGEIIGGASGYDQNRNVERLTLFIENCELQAKHAQITLNHYCQYFVKDLSIHETSNGGIWFKVPTHGTGLDLYANHNYQRRYQIGKQHLLEFVETEEFLDEVAIYLTQHNATFAIFPMQQENIHTLIQMIAKLPSFLQKVKYSYPNHDYSSTK